MKTFKNYHNKRMFEKSPCKIDFKTKCVNDTVVVVPYYFSFHKFCRGTMLTQVAVCLTMKQIIFPFPRAPQNFMRS